MECPKCKHKIYLDLTPEEMVYCPYCEQRMIPPEEFNICSACGGVSPLSSIYCLSCAKKLMPEEEPVIDQPQTQPTLPNREDIASLVNEEPPAVQEPEPPSMSHIGGTLTPRPEELPTGYQVAEPPPDHYRGDIPLQTVNEESLGVGQAPPEPRVMHAPKIISAPFVEEEPVIYLPPAQTTLQANEDMAMPANEELSAVQKPPEPRAMPVLEVIPPYVVEEASPPRNKQLQAHPVPSREDIAQTVNEGPPAITPAPTEARTTPHIGDTRPNDEFGFCIACGQKLSSDFLYCPRCGKSTKVPEFRDARVESLQTRIVRRHEDAVRPVNEEPPVMKKLLRPSAMSYPGEIPSKTIEEPAPIPIRYVQPKYRPVPSREPISEAMDDRTPAMQPFPSAKAPARAPLKTAWPKIRVWSAKVITPARDFISGHRNLRRLHGKSVRGNVRPPIDLSSAEALKLKRATIQGKGHSYREMRSVYIILGVVVMIVFFIFIGVEMSR